MPSILNVKVTKKMHFLLIMRSQKVSKSTYDKPIKSTYVYPCAIVLWLIPSNVCNALAAAAAYDQKPIVSAHEEIFVVQPKVHFK